MVAGRWQSTWRSVEQNWPSISPAGRDWCWKEQPKWERGTAEAIHLYGHWGDRQSVDVRNQSLLKRRKENHWIICFCISAVCLFTDGSSMLEDTATLTVRSSWVEDLGRMSAIRAEHSKTLHHQQLLWKWPGGLGVPTPYPASWWLLWLTSAAFSSQPPPARNQPPGHPLWVWRKTTGRCPCRSRGGARLSWGWLPPPSAPWGGRREKRQAIKPLLRRCWTAVLCKCVCSSTHTFPPL